MADRLNVITIVGSLRKGSFNAALARQIPKWQPAGMSITAAPPWADLPIYNADDQNSTGFPATATKLSDAVHAADGVIFVTPEYNYSIPGGLKNAIDWVSRMKEQPFKDKPVAIQSATPSLLGGSRMQYHLRQSLTSINALIFSTQEHTSELQSQTKLECRLLLEKEDGIKLITQ